MERKIMERRTILKGGAAAIGMLGAASTTVVTGVEQASADAAQPPLPDQISAAFQRFREAIPANFDRDYVEKAIIPFFLTSFYEGERPMLPMIDVNFSKQNALPFDLWGLITRDWRPTPEEGVTVFLEGLEKRGPDNLRKRIYFTGVTPDLYKPVYSAKVVAFFDKLMDQNSPTSRSCGTTSIIILTSIGTFTLGWPEAIPFEVRQIGEAFNTVLAYRNPLLPITYDNYMIVRERLDFLKSWIDDRLTDIESGKTKNPEKTIAWYWLKNAGDGTYFAKKDVVFECFHNFVALSQWGNSIFGIMSRLSENGGDQAVRASFQKTMSGNFDNAGGAPFSPLELFVMELFRVISPNGGSISAIQDARTSAYGASPQRTVWFSHGTPQLHQHAAHKHQPRPSPLEGPECFRSTEVSGRPYQCPDHGRQRPADRPCAMPI